MRGQIARFFNYEDYERLSHGPTSLFFQQIHVDNLNLFHCDSLALTERVLSQLEPFHRHLLGRVLRIRYPAHIGSQALDAKCQTVPRR